MFEPIDLTHRQQHILWATVQHYVATAEPVGSKALVDEYNLSVSSATIRSGMGALEKVGLLYQPHTSAGRIPSDFGYRLYVDELMTPSATLSQQVTELLSDRLNWQNWSLEALLRGAAQLLSNVSGYITLITLPQTQTAQVRHLQLVQVDPKRVMLVVVTDGYETRSALMDLAQLARETAEVAIDPETLERELQILSNFLNDRLRGRSLGEVAALDWSELDREFSRYADSIAKWLSDLTEELPEPISNRMMVSGIAEVLRQPEFAELARVQTLLALLEEERDLLGPLMFVPTLGQSLPSKRANVLIGAENPLEPMRICTLVSATYQRDTVPIGSVGVLGPTRMVYEDAIALVEATADYLSDTLSQKN
ncbi:MAG: heat-inducible transcriptional repressor HrcA [Cyanobacteriota bacterium]|nr:heat-inducible transcriptional repressor HrcA [Cyanobacteriota bacterium]